MQTHDLKIWPEHFRAVASGEKTVELRKDDRRYEVGDELLLHEYDPDTASYTGSECRRRITHIDHGGPWLHQGYCALSIANQEESTEAQLMLYRLALKAIATGELVRCDTLQHAQTIAKDALMLVESKQVGVCLETLDR
ncbi:ASCH/PUA domain-containing protein [Sulfoacidibacillus ferrooxidans]|uniref:DUF3850 domain-containing protein n=1 Tax=Sulfoacidibacillus ferrooxidans TaxID=2005001 RepID=A0A9X1VB63_9BACL|nr:ASCH/PUA domain-containing protein [Sulfoacidibacillus ferrooxidans]MCI0184472.1 hypothetical protein [Sulfoacidibacillus ferrooxidans]